MMLLNDEEIKLLRARNVNTYTDTAGITHSLWFEEVLVKAQLKKVVEILIERYCVDHSTPSLITIEIPLIDWQSILKEIE